jgi:hypothetical protein
MTPAIRKLALTAHVTSSVGWLGPVVVYLAVALGGLTSDDPQMVRAAYLHAIGGLVVILTTTVLPMYKPWGRTPYGRRMQLEPQPAAARVRYREVRASLVAHEGAPLSGDRS